MSSSYYNPTPEENEAYKQLFIAATKGQGNTIGGTDAVKFFVSSGKCFFCLLQQLGMASKRGLGKREREELL
jgi:hypothetical protein